VVRRVALVLVFIWPVVPVLAPGPAGPTPSAWKSRLSLVYVLVLIMGAGNYLGLRYSLSAALWIGGTSAGRAPFGVHDRRLVLAPQTGGLWDAVPGRRRFGSPTGRSPAAAEPSPAWALDPRVARFSGPVRHVWARRVQETIQ